MCENKKNYYRKGASDMAIFKRGQIWYVRLQSEGQTIKVSTKSKDKKVAEAMQRELERQAELVAASNLPFGAFVKALQKAKNPKTFEEAANEYLANGTFKPSSISSYSNNLNKHLLPAFGSRALNAITPSCIRSFQSNLAKSGLSPRRVNSIVQLLRSIFRQALVDEVIDRDPSQAVKRLPEPRANIDPLDDEELAQALANIEPHYQPLFKCLAYSGARPNELIALRWTDIGWAKEEISITKGRVRGHEGPPKTPSSQRIIPMAPEVKDALEQLEARKVLHKDKYVFLTKRGEPVGKHLDLVWAKALKKAGVRHRAAYQLRHTFASRALINGFPGLYVAQRLGHSIETLHRNYARWINTADKVYDDKVRQGGASKLTEITPVIVHA